MQQLQANLRRLDQELTNPNISLAALNSAFSSARQLQEDLQRVDASAMQKQLVNDRVSQLIIDIQMLIHNYKEPAPPVAAPAVKPRMKTSDFENSHKLMDETIEMASTAQGVLASQTEHLRRIHEKVLNLTNEIEVGGRTVTQILHMEQLGGFLRVGGVAIIVVVLLVVKLCW